ncbi:MAG: phenylacetate-CoA oxygenase subunit PaaC [Gammaproteobacteria bacterium]|nr:phenylacetate-CoA oxygenase subunit PaaC [Gammaproteobacteria bacterium]MBT3723190.1 phenylacetate-CoA oxygenase subunit PaaC [Gammaproteobacteria bacterium]MBT4076941.1 phenylacetate-CoA oxygenase subunit PaaC [Gammaproteobacteria bacterium]MBT4193721.1 phenylacetate-CoA oxygenase subunit PaaC [Gammaproteobacteria bacterium]MBT4450124.1 phenylacetate-CoA oxygenase subunit PaaC [Gammaproteobacteria bacterium]
MNDETKQAVLNFTVRLGDDAVVMGHRVAEWCRNAPFLEEDLALSNVALDFIGRARMFYGYAAELANDGRKEDDFAYMRDHREYQNLLIMELPRGDFAYTMVRQLLVDVFNLYYLEQLMKSTDEMLAAIAAKSIKETRYHLRRSQEWVLRLGLGTEESKSRAQKALDDIWGFTHELFDLDELEQQMAGAGIGVDNGSLKESWSLKVKAILLEASLTVPEDGWKVKGGREGYHTEYLGQMLNEMQCVHRANPGLEW